MKDLKKSPLCSKADIQVYRPPIEYFVDKIKNQECFSFTRQMHGMWDGVIAAWLLNPAIRRIRISDDTYIRELASAMSEGKKQMADLHYDADLYVELLEIFRELDSRDTSFLFGVSDTYFYPQSPPPHQPHHFFLPDKCTFNMLLTKDHLNFYKTRFEDQHRVIELLVPPGYPLFDAMIWKLYCYHNHIWKFFEAIKNHRVILVGPVHYKDFDKIAGFTNYHHLEIHSRRASSTRKDVLDQIVEMHKEFSHDPNPPIYFFVAGSISVYWVHYLHKLLENKYLIDVGQAFNFLYDSKTSLVHGEFGFSSSVKKGRRPYKVENVFGERSFQSKMTIEDNLVQFELKLNFRDIWFDMLIGTISKRLINLYRLRKNVYRLKHVVNIMMSRGT